MVTASFCPIFCYWRIEQELLHTFYSQQLTRWQGADILGHLLQILGQWQQGADHALLEKELLDFSTTLTECPLPSTPCACNREGTSHTSSRVDGRFE